MGGYIGATAVGLTTTAADVQGDITSTDTTPELILKNTSEEDTEGGREGKITFKGEQSGGEESTLAQIESAHDGTSDDQKGDLIFKTNDGSDGASPTERMRIDSEGLVTITNASNDAQLKLESTDADASFGPKLKMYRNSGSPADNDLLGNIEFEGRNDNSQDVVYGRLFSRISDASDGTEDGIMRFDVMKGGSLSDVLTFTPDELVVNDGSYDYDFRVESNDDANAFFVQGSSGFVGIGTSSPSEQINLVGSGGTSKIRFDGDSSNLQNNFIGITGYDDLIIASDEANSASASTIQFRVDATERMRIDSSGNVLVGKTVTSSNTAGGRLSNIGSAEFIRSGGQCLYLNRQSNDGTIASFAKDGTAVGSIGNIGTGIYIAAPTSGGAALLFSDNANVIYPSKNNSGTVAVVDDYVDLGASALRFDDVFATNGTIQTSDETEKQNIASLTSAEITAATAISKLFKTYKWKDAVTAKGDDARTHTGVVAQQVQTAMSEAGLDTSKYAFWCSDTWWTKDVEVAAVEVDEENGIEAKDAYTRTDYYYTADEAPEGATEHTRMGIRYPELLAFVGAATEQRLTSIEARLTALEAE